MPTELTIARMQPFSKRHQGWLKVIDTCETVHQLDPNNQTAKDLKNLAIVHLKRALESAGPSSESQEPESGKTRHDKTRR